jgi:Protein of unknown function (DUF732)
LADLTFRPDLSAIVIQRYPVEPTAQPPPPATARRRRRPWERRLLVCLVLTSALLIGIGLSGGLAHARGDAVAYLVNVTVRPRYNFANAEAALTYGHRICDKASEGRTYAGIIAEIKADFQTTDEYQAAYLISQAVNALCPALIWQVRNSAAGHLVPHNDG